MCGLLEHGQKPYDDVLSNGLACVECAAAVIGSYKHFLALWMFKHAVRGLETCKAGQDSISEGVLSQTTCGSKSWTRGSYLAVTAITVYSVYYPRLLGLSTAESVLFS